MSRKIQFAMYAPYTASLPNRPTNQDSAAVIPGGDTPQNRYSKILEKIKLVGLRTKGVLTIFMAPEWAFRKKNGFYSYQDIQNIIEDLRKQSGKKELEHMMIVPGSMLWSVPVNKKEVIKRRFRKNKAVTRTLQMVFNSVPIIHHGRVNRIYHKLHNAGDVDTTKGEEMPLAVTDNFSADDFFTDLRPASGIFECEGIQFGIEICRDYSEKTLLREYLSKDLSGRGVDIHLIVASGIYNLSNSGLVARKNGYAVLCEGARANPNSNLNSNQVVKITQRKGSIYASSHNTDSVEKVQIQKVAIPENGTVGNRVLLFEKVDL